MCRKLKRNVALLCLWPLVLAACEGGKSRPESDAGVGADGAEADIAELVYVAGDAHDHRYCEILAVYLDGADMVAEVWNTAGFNDCPQGAWEALDPEAIKAELGALRVVMNGPRYMLMDEIVRVSDPPEADPYTFGTIEMDLVARLFIDLAQASAQPYIERSVDRGVEFTFLAGAEVYELVSNDGATYVMQSYAQIADPSLTKADLAGLGDRLALPDGWHYRTRTLTEHLVISGSGLTTVLQDDLDNTYSRY